ncbi:LOW QUALITY PROTEIN: class I histocompatibility antigen, F10 alpha chain-like [Pseudochaenichthys georgianus]|uniref:LOW QUALITY PROTEIN: class I histocompatibility antigen, F10 alpha chain-like n=1 Tax=Pseudochaenichthys georgianus TaxID=52239 RepID=UPI00146A26B5|nr:LOW QUALITY PROTEIN: H-2 class I histocompatibility antigen, Q9 alpha chain-like [Pseudochaenichthys georgianus]
MKMKRKRKMLLFLLLLGIVGPHCTSARTHSLTYFHTVSSGVTTLPEFVVVGLVDDVETVHYDSNTKRAEPKQDWMKNITDGDTRYWERADSGLSEYPAYFKVDIETVKQRLNQTGGVHIFQWMYGCEWDDETGEVKGYHQYGFDGEDFIALDLKTETYIAPRPEAVLTKLKWEKDKAWMAQQKNYFTQICPDYLKKYVNLGRSSLMRTEMPSVSLLQKSPSSPVSCHATGFYPDRAAMFWTRDGEQLHDNVDPGEMLPNHDGSFQMSVALNVSSFPADHWGKYRCVFQLSGVKEDHVIVLDPAGIRTNRGNPLLLPLTIGAAVAALALLLIAGVGLLVYRKWNGKKNTPSPASSAELTPLEGQH